MRVAEHGGSRRWTVRQPELALEANPVLRREGQLLHGSGTIEP
jgi:hypothetical protein